MMRDYEFGVERTSRLGFTLLIALVLFTANACQSGNGSNNAVTRSDITAVMDAHVNELMAIPGVTAVAVGESDDGTPCILILILEQTDELDQRIPKSLDGHPVCVRVSGEIKPMDGG